MSPADHSTSILFRIHPADGGSEVPVSLLTQGLASLQELIHLFALQEEGVPLRRRLRLSDEIKNLYVLRCSPPEPGSFVVTARVAGPIDDLFATERAAKVVRGFHAFGHAAVSGLPDRLQELVPDSRLRNRILGRFISLSPPAGSGHRYELGNGEELPILLDENLPSQIEHWLKPEAERAEVQTVTGRLEAISFGEHRVTILYRPRSRGLECYYDEDLEPMLLENRRDLIQVTGRIIMDDDGHPSKIVEVEEIRELDLSPFIVREVTSDRWRLKAASPVTLHPCLSDNEQFIQLRHDAWGLDVFAPTRLELFEELKEQLCMLWIEYARANAQDLSEPALKVKEALMATFSEVPNA